MLSLQYFNCIYTVNCTHSYGLYICLDISIDNYSIYNKYILVYTEFMNYLTSTILFIITINYY